MLGELEKVAVEAARAAARVHQGGALKDLRVESKSSASDLVTRVDREAEDALIAVITKARPRDSIISEEGASRSGSSEVTWVLDPLDGTANLVHGHPHYAVSVGVLVNGKRRLGVVLDSSDGRLYVGVKGRGATCEATPLTPSHQTELQSALVGTGFLPDPVVRVQQAEILKSVLPKVLDIRRSGSPALDLCSVASGRLDAYYEFGLGAWDIAAGAVVAEAAGARVLEIEGGPLPSPLLIAGSDALVESLLSLLKVALKNTLPGGPGFCQR
jgi:myo-inositol-1(or 4)-monophosphatase